MSMIANSEQEKAIKHNGGVLLRAGAGSGKTFVLIEHIIYLFQKFIDENATLEASQFEIKLKEYMESIILMTFTKKASGELAIRLKKRLHQLSKGVRNNKQWKVIWDLIGNFFVGTIHGFCQKLIFEDHFSHLHQDPTRISEGDLRVILDQFFIKFLENNYKKNDLLRIFSLNRNDLIKSMASIFSDASLRIEWEKIEVKQMVSNSSSEVLDLIIKAKGLAEIFTRSDWEHDYLKNANRCLKSKPRNAKDMKGHLDFFNSYKRLPSKRKNDSQQTRDFFEMLKEYRNFLRDNIDHFESFENYKDDIVLEWLETLKVVFDELNKCYKNSKYMSYADLEYIVFKGLANLSDRMNVTNTYKYLIIDEFQDTSQVQFEIIKRVVNDDFKRLFVVGDVKQAIYSFRGGDVSIFENCERNFPQVIDLKNNYRSCGNIVKFNNHFFKDILYRGNSFQNTKAPSSELGEVKVIKYSADNLNNPSKEKLKTLEADKILSVIEEKFEGTTCVLYKKIAPSLELLTRLKNKGIACSFQVKIKKEEEPILMIFYLLIESYLLKKDFKKTLFLINKIFEYLEIDNIDTEEGLKIFYTDIENFGSYIAYLKFIFNKNISTSLSEINLSFIKSLLEICHDDLEKFYSCFRLFKDEAFSFYFETGSSKSKIQVMTVHSSKGLEFDRVILGGISNNKTILRSDDGFGRYPGGFKWKANARQKNFYKSPWFLWEYEERKYKTLAEDKRLLYVAATRGRKELIWVDFEPPDSSGKSIFKNWVDILRENTSGSAREFVSYQDEILNEKKSFNFLEKRPFFHENQIGILSKSTGEQNIFILGELSVTRISMLAQCPRKFYFGNILKLDEDHSSIIYKDNEFNSSSERGIAIHDELAQMIQNWEKRRVDSEIKLWIENFLIGYEDARFYSEREVKFLLFGVMISGIPDLVIENSSGTSVWDFKTGLKRADDSHYWLQLKLYALALWKTGSVDKKNSIELSLLYLDEKKKYDKKVKFLDIDREVSRFWKLTNSVHQVNRDHCPECYYGKLCRF